MVRIELRNDRRQRGVGVATVNVELRPGHTLSLERDPGGVIATERDPRNREYHWAILGAARDESGALDEALRQALVPDVTYRPSIAAASALSGL
jgi:hypothetical protein